MPRWPCIQRILQVSQDFSARHLRARFPTSWICLPKARGRRHRVSQRAHTCVTSSDALTCLGFTVPGGGLACTRALRYFAATFTRIHLRHGFTFIACAHLHGRRRRSYFRPYQLTTGQWAAMRHDAQKQRHTSGTRETLQEPSRSGTAPRTESYVARGLARGKDWLL